MMFKKTLMAVVASTTLLTTVPVASAATALPPVTTPALAMDVIVDGYKASFPDTEPFVDAAGNTLVPIRFVSEKLGAKVKWAEATETVTIEYNGKTIVMPIGAKVVKVNREDVTLAAAAIRKEGRTMVPLRFVSETLESEVAYDASYNGINITSPAYKAKVEAGAVKLDQWGRELRANQTSKEWTLMSDTLDKVYSIKKYMITHADGIDIGAKEYGENFSKEEVDRIVKNIKEYYKLALNVDYRTVNFTNYRITTFNLTGHNGYMDSTIYQKFVNFAKNNKVVVEGYAFPDSTTIYNYHGTKFIRTKFKFRVLNANDYTQFSMDSYDPSFRTESPKWVEKGQWYETYSDVSLFTNHQDIYGTLKTGSTENMFTKGSYLYKELK